MSRCRRTPTRSRVRHTDGVLDWLPAVVPFSLLLVLAVTAIVMEAALAIRDYFRRHAYQREQTLEQPPYNKSEEVTHDGPMERGRVGRHSTSTEGRGLEQVPGRGRHRSGG